MAAKGRECVRWALIDSRLSCALGRPPVSPGCAAPMPMRLTSALGSRDFGTEYRIATGGITPLELDSNLWMALSSKRRRATSGVIKGEHQAISYIRLMVRSQLQ